VALSVSTLSWAQDCPDCIDHIHTDAHVSGAYDAGVVPAGRGVHGACASKANYWYRPFTDQSQPDVFYNYYVPNSYGSPAAAYPAPFPTPSLVGHTYYTYQPLMPHEWLYKHHRSYHQYYNNGMGLNRTIVKWQGRPFVDSVKTVRNVFRLPR
jgi:hypothetical protein